MRNRVRMLLWFLQRPSLYPHVMYLALKKLSRASSVKNNTRQEAMQWCGERCVDSSTAIKRLTGFPAPEPIERLFPDVFSIAAGRANECPTTMGGPGDLDLLYSVAEHLGAVHVIETGVAYGWSSLAILLSLKNRVGSRLISADMPIPNGNSEQYVGCVVPPEMRSHWSLLRWADRQALPKALKELGAIELCHYDSDKSYEGRMWAYPVLWKALKQDGVFISDDIGDNVAFREFSEAVACEPLIVRKGDTDLSTKYIGVLVKRGDSQTR